jgi:hypothetical protein
MTDQAWQSSIDEFQCAKCGAIYDVAITRVAARADYDAICNVCQKVMNEWHGTVGRAYTLKSQSAKCATTVDRYQFIHRNRPFMFLVAAKVGRLSKSLVRRSYSMISSKTPALAEFPPKRDVTADCGSQGPMSQHNTDGSGRNELHPQKLVQLVGFRDPNARKQEGAEPVAAVLASAA